MKIYVDADACPVKEIIIKMAAEYSLETIFIYSTCHVLKNKFDSATNNIKHIIVDNESQAADMAIMNRVQKEDLVITGDFGLAAMVLGKGAGSLSFNGRIYNEKNIDRLLFERHISSSIRRGGGKTKGPSKRTLEDNKTFENNLRIIIMTKIEEI